MKTILSALLATIVLAAPALANPCAGDLKAVDAALLTAKLAPADLKKVQDLRAAGEKASKENKPGDCLKAVGEAKKLLGVK
jgi:hypothetical protein